MADRTCADCGCSFSQTGPGKPRKWCYGCKPRGSCGCIRCRTPNLKLTCLTCRRGFEYTGSGRVPTYCSFACRQWWREFDKRAQRTVALWARTCKVCDRSIYARGTGDPIHGQAGKCGGGNAVYCSRDCYFFDKGEKLIIADRCRVPWRECEDCGTDFVGYWNRQRPLCPGCRLAGKRDAYRRKNAKRRSAQRPGIRYSLSEIAERDGHRCHLCNRKVNMDLSGDHKRGPTIDHLIPLSAGGADVPDNVSLAHRSCNCERRDIGPAQLRFTA